MTSRDYDETLSDDELRRLLPKDDYSQLGDLVEQITHPSKERSVILATHLAIESLLEAILETILVRPKEWIETANYWDKVNLSKAMNLIGDQEAEICKIVNIARNKMAHSLKPLPMQLREKMHGLAEGLPKHKSDLSDVIEICVALVTKITAPYLYARHKCYMGKLLKEHEKIWKELIYRKMDEHPELVKEPVDMDAWRPILKKLDVELVKEIEAREAKEPGKQQV